MVIVRPTTLLAAVGGTFPRRSELAMYGIQLVSKGNVEWAKKAAWWRNVPYTAVEPHLGQMEARIHFGELAKECAGRDVHSVAAEIGGQVYDAARQLILYEGEILPKCAAYLKAKMKGYRAAHRLEPSEYPSRVKRSMHTVEELKKRAERAARASRGPVTIGTAMAALTR